MDLLTMAGAIAIVVVAFAIADYLEAKAKALRPTVSDKDDGEREDG